MIAFIVWMYALCHFSPCCRRRRRRRCRRLFTSFSFFRSFYIFHLFFTVKIINISPATAKFNDLTKWMSSKWRYGNSEKIAIVEKYASKKHHCPVYCISVYLLMANNNNKNNWRSQYLLFLLAHWSFNRAILIKLCLICFRYLVFFCFGLFTFTYFLRYVSTWSYVDIWIWRSVSVGLIYNCEFKQINLSHWPFDEITLKFTFT